MGRRRRRKGSLEGLDTLVRKVYPAPDQVPAVRVFRWWYRAVPDRVAERARPTFLKNGVLHVAVASSTWAHELSYLKEDLLRRCQRYAPEARLTDIRFRVGKLPPRPYRPPFEPRREPEPVPPEQLVRLPEEVARSLARIDDDRVREAVTRAATLSISRKSQK